MIALVRATARTIATVLMTATATPTPTPPPQPARTANEMMAREGWCAEGEEDDVEHDAGQTTRRRLSPTPSRPKDQHTRSPQQQRWQQQAGAREWVPR